MVNIQKCAIIGCGFVGATTAFTLIEHGVFSELVLIDANNKKAEGEAMDLNHGIPFAKPVKVYAGNYDDLSDCSLIIIAAGANQKPGETRIDLVKKNTAILKSIIPEITKRNKECILLILSNPVDILTYITLKISGFPKNRVIGSGTVLDTARLKYLLAEHLSVDSRNVHAFIIGEHGDSELAVWSSANISGIDLKDFCGLCGKCTTMENIYNLYNNVRESAYKIIDSKGATYYAIAMATLRIVECIVRDEKSVIPVSTLVEGEYGINDVCMGLPSIVGKNGVERILEIPLNKNEAENLLNSAREINEYIKLN
mgnify:FL=1